MKKTETNLEKKLGCNGLPEIKGARKKEDSAPTGYYCTPQLCALDISSASLYIYLINWIPRSRCPLTFQSNQFYDLEICPCSYSFTRF